MPRLRRPAPAPTPAPPASDASPPPARRKAARPGPAPSTLWGVGLAGAGALLGLGGLLALRPVETLADPFDPLRLLVYALLVLGPLAVFWATARALWMGRFWIFGTLVTAAFGYVIIFVPPPDAGAPDSLAVVAGFLALLFLALLAGLTLPLHALGWALFTQRARRQDVRRAIRQAGLLAAYSVACLGMVMFSVFNGLNALLLFVVLALAEFFFLSRG